MTERQRLVQEYPFLVDKKVDINLAYSFYTYFDSLPITWVKNFGEKLCAELKEALIEEGEFENYKVLQVKEKFGVMRWYDNSNNPRIQSIIQKYESLSEKICARCGAPATHMTTGWILPICDNCDKEMGNG